MSLPPHLSRERRHQAPRPSDVPISGFYLIRRVKRGPMIPARIQCVNGLWSVTINGILTGPANREPWKVRDMEAAFLGQVTDEADYLKRLAWKDIPGHPNANPYKPIDLNSMPVLP